MTPRPIALAILSAAIVLLPLLASGCSAQTSPSPSSSAQATCDPSKPVDALVCDQIEEATKEVDPSGSDSPSSADINVEVGPLFSSGYNSAPESVGIYRLVTPATLEEYSLTCAGDVLSTWEEGDGTIYAHYASPEGFEALHKYDDMYCGAIAAAGTDGDITLGLIDIISGFEQGEAQAEPTCRTTATITSCYDFLLGGQVYVSSKMAATESESDSNTTFMRAFFDAYNSAVPYV